MKETSLDEFYHNLIDLRERGSRRNLI